MRAKRGLLDLFTTVIACTAVYTQTPIGGLLDRGAAWIFGLEKETRPLTSFFALDDVDRDNAPTGRELELIIAARNADAPVLLERARNLQLPFDLLQALELAGGNTGIRLDQDQWLAAETLLGEKMPSGGRSKPSNANLGAAVLIQHQANLLASPDAGLESFLLGTEPVERAIRLARNRGVSSPERLASHQRYLTRSQREKVRPFVNQVMGIRTALTFEWPLRAAHRLTSPFGERSDPFLGTRKKHNGVDLAVPIRTPVHAVQNGEVLYATFDGINGHFAKMSHGYGLTTAYCHNSEVRVSKGDRPNRGDIIALSGNSGRSTGPHLHFIVRLGGKAVDPMLFR